MTTLLELLRNGGAFVLVLGTLVFIHELGHYLAARWTGVHVEAFSIGFGPKIAGWTDRLGTEWKLSWLPLGGYVKLHGQERPEDAAPEVRAAWLPGRTFHEKSVAARALVVAAGPIANFLLAAVLFAALFLAIGRPFAVPTIGEVVPGGAAAKAGLLAGDRVTSIDGAPITRFDELQKTVEANPDRTLNMTVQRGDGTLNIPVLVGSRTRDGKPSGVLSIKGGQVEYERVGPFAAIAGGVKQTVDVTAGTLAGLGQMITGQRGTEELSGPLGIAKLSGQVAQLGFATLVSFIAVLSVNLALINLFPIPVLDGGHLLFYLAEAVRGRPLGQRTLEYGFRAGLALIACLFVFATWNDLTHLGLFRWVASLIG